MSDDLPDPGAGEDDAEPARGTTRTDDTRDRPIETDSIDAGDTPETLDADGPSDRESTEEGGEESDETGEGADEVNGGRDETTPPAETDVVDAAWRAAVETGALVTRPAPASAVGADRQQRPTTHVSTDRLFEVLASPGNRFVLTYLLRVDERAEYAELVEYVVAQTDPPGELTKGTFRGRVAARLVTESLPALADAGLVEVDSDEQVVAATAATRVVAPYLALALSDLVDPVGSE